MSLRIKMALLVVLTAAVSAGYLNVVWMPQAMRKAEDMLADFTGGHLKTVSASLRPLLLGGDIDGIHENLNVFLKNNPEWISLSLFDGGGRNLFFTQRDGVKGVAARTFKDAIVFRGSVLGRIVLTVDFKTKMAAFHEENLSLRNAVLGGFLLAMVLVVGFIEILVIRPARKLGQAANALAAGDFSAGLPPPGGNEIGVLTEAFSAMRDNIHRTQDQLKEACEKFRSVIENTAEGIIAIDEKGSIETFNPAAERIFGFEAGEVLGKSVSILLPREERVFHECYIEQSEITLPQIIHRRRELTGMRKNGTEFPLEINVAPMDVGGKRMFVGILRDISERRKVEKMKNEFISIVSHELRTPLTSILGSLGLVKGIVGDELPEKARSMIGIAHANSNRLVHLIDDLLDMEKIATGKMDLKMAALDLQKLTERALEENRGCAEKNSIRLVQTDRLPGVMVMGDEDRLLQVYANFLSNAVKFSPKGGTVEVALRREGDRVRLSVTDHGPGIPDEFQGGLFKKFAQADSSDSRERGGTGLGLCIAKAITEKHDGKIGFHSEEGKGATFFITLAEVRRPLPGS